jgi:methylated-DNA-[protein]-cysteine S-methyltransferase
VSFSIHGKGAAAASYMMEPTVFGEIAIVWTPGGVSPVIERVVLPLPGISSRTAVLERFGDIPERSRREIEEVAARIGQFCEGAPIRFELDLIALDRCSPFQREVLEIEHAIPYAMVSTYGRIARRAGRPGAARAVGNALSNNPFPIIIPCHRAIRSDLGIGGFQGGLAMKRSLLRNEGHRFDSKMRLIDPRICY